MILSCSTVDETTHFYAKAEHEQQPEHLLYFETQS
jgi:hypothetical protein